MRGRGWAGIPEPSVHVWGGAEGETRVSGGEHNVFVQGVREAGGVGVPELCVHVCVWVEGGNGVCQEHKGVSGGEQQER